MHDRNAIQGLLAGTPVTIFFQDEDGNYLWFANPCSVWETADRTGANERDLFGESDRERLAKAKAESSRTGETKMVELAALDRSGETPVTRHIRLTVKPSRDLSAKRDGYVCSSVDISDQKQREQTLKNLLREVAHRSKNMLAMVLSLSAQTARVSPTKEEYIRRFTGRLQSLAKSQDAITDRDWHGSTISDLVARQVADVIPFKDGLVVLSGDDIELGPNGSLHVGLALHELVSNALVHGALTVPAGRVEINCSLLDDPQTGAVLTWTETPRVQVAQIKPKSFGRTMLERIVPSALGGTGSLELNSDAVVYTLKIAPSEIV